MHSDKVCSETLKVREVVYRLLNHVGFDVSKVALEVSILWNLHIRRCIDEKEPIPKLDQGFILPASRPIRR
jgi:hypothetical protein